jgi:hypothetical protein
MSTTRRSFVGAAAALGSSVFLANAGLSSAFAAQEATPGDDLSALGLPSLDVHVTGTGFEGIPASLVAGRYHLHVTIAEELLEQGGGGVAFVQPAGMTGEEFLEAVNAFVAGMSGEGEASPGADAPASPESGSGIPSFFFQSTFPGGAYSMDGTPGEAIIDLGPGSWVAWADDPAAAQMPVVFEVTGEMPADLAEPSSSAVVTMGEYVIEVTEGELIAGPQIIRVDNIGAQPHFVEFLKGPDDMTVEQVQVALEEEMQGEMSGTPVAYSGLNPETDFEFVGLTGTQSRGTSQWAPLDLEPGTYLVICFFPDMGDGAPHAYHGMFNVITIAG